MSHFTISTRASRVAFYDLDSSPTSYDILSFLACVRPFSRMLHVVFVPGSVNGFREDHKPIDNKERDFRLHHILIPACKAVGATFTVCPTREQARMFYSPEHFPIGYTIENKDFFHTMSGPLQFAKHGVKPPHFMPSTQAYVMTKRMYPERHPVVITLRECYTPERNSNIDAWLALYEEIRGQYEVVFIRDTEKLSEPFPAPTCQVAALDFDMRCALMRHAALNMGVSNGPLSIAVYSTDLPYLIFKMWCEAWPASSTLLKKWGFDKGSQFPWRGAGQKVVWEPDEADTLISEFRAWEADSKLEAAA